MVSHRSLSRALPVGLALVALVALTGTVVAQQPRPPEVPTVSPIIGFVVSLAVNLVIGGIVLAIAPDFVRRNVERIREDAVASFGWGLVSFIVLVLASILIITLIVTIPLLIVLGIVGGAVGSVAIGLVLAGRSGDPSLWVALAVGAVLLALLGQIPFVGGLVSFVVAWTGAGAVLRGYNASRKEQGKRAI
jgi:hypothetical protein